MRGRLARRGYDLVYAHFHEMAAWIKPALLSEAGDVPVAVDSVDLHYVRRLREADLPAAAALAAPPWTASPSCSSTRPPRW